MNTDNDTKVSTHAFWIERYGKEKADSLLQAFYAPPPPPPPPVAPSTRELSESLMKNRDDGSTYQRAVDAQRHATQEHVTAVMREAQAQEERNEALRKELGAIPRLPDNASDAQKVARARMVEKAYEKASR
jgi:hypothetical protein